MIKQLFRSCIFLLVLNAALSSCSNNGVVKESSTADKMGRFPEKGDMIMLTDRPPQLETPLNIFQQDITPNDYFFVRWHLSQILTKIDIDTFRLYIGGAVDKPIAISMKDLKSKYPADSVIALAICSGNSRSTFSPRVPSGQWGNGAMGNAKWKGVKLKTILEAAGIKKGAIEVTFQGMDKGPLPDIPVFVKSLSIDHALDGEVLIAYEMNGQDIPMLNGYPLKLVVPGWYATYWVGSLNTIKVLTDTFKGFWMTKAYQVVNNAEANESPDSPAKVTVPVSHIKLNSIFILPEPHQPVAYGQPCHVEGLAFNDGTGIKKVEVSVDSGKNWMETTLNPEISKYSWRRWKYEWVPKTIGINHLMVRATDNNGFTQTSKQWNRGGYAKGFIEQLDVKVK